MPPAPLPPVLLLGSDCLTGLQVARLLWRRGVRVIGVAEHPGSPYCRSRALARVVPAERLADPIGLVREIAASEGARPVVLPCTDDHAQWLNAARDRLAPHADFLLPDADTLERLSDKASFYRSVRERGLAMPETRFVESDEALARAAAELGFPLVLKPPRRTAAWFAASGVAKVCRVDGPEALARVGPGLLASVGELIVQAWVPGPEDAGRELLVCLDAESEPLATVVLQKIRQWPADTGTGSLAAEVRDDEVTRTGLEMLQKFRYAGFGQLELKRSSRDGRLYIIEMNAGRAALNLPLCEAAGVEMTATWYRAAAGLPLPDRRRVTRPGARWICWKRDLPAAWMRWRRGELSLRDWLGSLRGIRWSADVALDDPGPLLLDALRRVGRRLGGARRLGTGRGASDAPRDRVTASAAEASEASEASEATEATETSDGRAAKPGDPARD